MSACHLCEHELAHALVVGTVARGGRPSRRVACGRCGLVQVDPPPSPEELDAYYEGAYHAEHGPVSLVVATHGPDGEVENVESVGPGSPRYDWAISVMHESRARFIRDELGLHAGANVLEIGGSDGRTAAELERMGLRVDLVEPDEGKAALARERVRGTVYVGTLADVVELADGAEPSYDAVISFHVLEHLRDPLSGLVAMRKLVKPGGWVWVEVPDTMRAGAPLEDHWQWVHLFDFNAHALAALFLRAGLVDVAADQVYPAHLHAKGRVVPEWDLLTFQEVEALAGAPYRRSDAPTGATVAEHLSRVASKTASPGDASRGLPAAGLSDADLLALWLEGQGVVDLARREADIERRLRRALAVVQSESRARDAAWDASVEILAKQQDAIRRDVVELLESHESAEHIEDPVLRAETRGFLNGLAMGRGEERIRTAKMLAHVANAMRRREAVG